MEWFTEPGSLIALLTLTVLEIVLGIDNIIFISILAGKLPKDQQNKARLIGLSLAMITRILLLFSIVWIMRLTLPLFTVHWTGNKRKRYNTYCWWIISDCKKHI